MQQRSSVAILNGIVLATTLSAVGAERAAPKGPVSIGSRLELFVDDTVIDRMSGVELRLHRPISKGKVLAFDKPWEGVTSDYHLVFKDEGLYRMYYRGSSHKGYAIPSMLHPGEVVIPEHDQVTGYAESRDGITWTKPSLGLFEFNGSRDNNIVWMGEPAAHNLAPFKDGNPAAPPAERYKAVGSDKQGGRPVLAAFVSPDGKRWKKLREAPVLTDGMFDSLNVAFWDAERGLYVAIYRDFVAGIRTIKFATSRNFVDWTAGQLADYGDAPIEHLYTNGVTPYFRAPHIYLGFPRRYLPWRTYLPDALWPGVSEGVFMSSRDGVHWDRRFMEAFTPPGSDPRNYMSRTNLPSWGVVPTSADEISMYVLRNRDFPSVHLERVVLRTDGFASVRAGYPGGEFRTRPLVFTGSTLVLNHATSAAGSIRVEIQDADGKPLPGFALEDSPVIWGDRIEEEVRWKRFTRTESALLKPLAGVPIRLRFVMRDTDLYSFRFR
jgi:hypothetical protein